MTRMVPSASDNGTLRRGSFTSPAVKVMLFQASAEKSELVWAKQMTTKRPKAVTAGKPFNTFLKQPRQDQKKPQIVLATIGLITSTMTLNIKSVSTSSTHT